MTKLAPEWVRTSYPVIRSPARYRWTTAPAKVPTISAGGVQHWQEDATCLYSCWTGHSTSLVRVIPLASIMLHQNRIMWQ